MSDYNVVTSGDATIIESLNFVLVFSRDLADGVKLVCETFGLDEGPVTKGANDDSVYAEDRLVITPDGKASSASGDREATGRSVMFMACDGTALQMYDGMGVAKTFVDDAMLEKLHELYFVP